MSRSSRTIGFALWASFIVLVGSSSPLAAQPPDQAPKTSPSDRAAAQVLFDEGRALMKQKRHEEACPKFAESQRLDPATGTQLNLAVCYEKIGKTVSAWINFLEAAAAAKKQGHAKRHKLAIERAKALEGKLSRIKIEVPSPVAGLTVKRNETVLRNAQWGIGVPVDPGSYQISATAPNKETWSKKVEVSKPGAVLTVTIPELEAAPTIPTDEGTEGESESSGTTQKILALVSAGIGVAGIIIGVAYGVTAINKNDDSLAYCPNDPNRCTADGVALRDEALTAGTVSTVGIVVGSAGLVTGLVLWLTAPSAANDAEDTAEPADDPGARIELAPQFDIGWDPSSRNAVGSAGVVLRGRW